MRAPRLILSILLGLSANVFAGGHETGGNSGGGRGGGSTEQVDRVALQLLIEGGGLKKAMINYLNTIKVAEIDDGVVRNQLSEMLAKNLAEDIQTSKYVLAIPGLPCKDAFNREVPAATQVGQPGSDVCFDLDKLLPALNGFSEEDVMVQLAGLAFHEHTHHFQIFDQNKVQENEDVANRIGGYILITAKFVQLPLLRWVKPESGPADFQVIQMMVTELKAKEQAFIAPKPSDFAAYPDYQGKNDRGVIRLLPRETYENKLLINGGGAYYSFARLDHTQGHGSDIELSQGRLHVGLGGCDFGYFASLGTMELDQINDSTPGVAFLTNLKAGKSEAAIRAQQNQYEVENQNIRFVRQVDNLKPNQTYLLRSINFDSSDVLVAFKILRFDQDGSLILAWKRLRSFPVSSCK